MKPEINTILYATDLSPNSAHALRFALDSAVLNSAKIVILHVFDRISPSIVPILDIYIDGKEQKLIFNERANETRARIEKRLKMVYEKELMDNPNYVDLIHSIEVCDGFAAEKNIEHGRWV